MKYLIYAIMFVLLLLCSIVYPQKTENGNSPSSPDGSPIRAYLNLNNISTIFKNTGISDINIGQDASGFKYPKETGKTAVYCSGFLWGANVNDPNEQDPHVGGTVYREGLQSGWIDASGNVIPETDPSVRIWRVRPDVYPGGPYVDLSTESLDEYKSEAEIRSQYELDWVEWPASIGAPYDDVDENGSYDPNFDVPGVLGANQTIWFVANDQAESRTSFMYGTQPMGLEMQATMWAYSQTGYLGNIFFRKYLIINKSDILGNPRTFDSMYISMWSDPDLGDSGDDYVGCDTVLNLGYCYNAFDIDSSYLPLPPPAVGFDLIRGPLVPGNPGEDKNRNGVDDIYDFGLTEDNQRVNGFINLPMTAFYYYINQDSILTDPVQGSYSEGAVRFYRFMKGKIGLTGEYFINPHTGLPTTFPLSGNPVDSTGWVDGQVHGPGDRRLGLSTGPLVMAPGDTQIVVIAEIAAGAIDGVTRKMAIDTLKYYSVLAQNFYDSVFAIVGLEDDIITLPNEYKLVQNYPNPFNPSTTINYQIAEFSFVTIKVYDVLGNEITTLINTEKPAGSYDVEFDGEELPSGIYFYNIQAGNFIQTKKMVLMK